MVERISCLVPFCRRTRGDRKGQPPITKSTEWICGDHWRLVPRLLKARRRRARRLADRIEDRFNALYMTNIGTWSDGQLRQVTAAQDVERRLWERCKTVAIERAVGIRA